MRVNIFSLSQELFPQFPCPRCLRFHVAKDDLGPFWENNGRPCRNRARRRCANERLPCPCGKLANNQYRNNTRQGSFQTPAHDGAPLSQHLGEGRVWTTCACGAFAEKRLDPLVCGVTAANGRTTSTTKNKKNTFGPCCQRFGFCPCGGR